MPLEDKHKFAIVTGLVVAGLIILLISISFADVHYYEYGFKKTKSTGRVDISTVYGPGRYFVGPDVTFKTFKADAHNVQLNETDVFTSDKLEVEVTVQFQYFLKKDDLPLLHKQFDLYYHPILVTNAQDALKDAATAFSKNEYISSRHAIEKAMFEAVRLRLGGTCCLKDCQATGTCVPGCKEYSECAVTDKGLFAEVRYFQLAEVDIPSRVEQNYLKALLIQEETETEDYLQEYTVVQKKTDAEVKDIDNEAAEIAQNATAVATLIRSQATANASAVIETARSDGLKLLYNGVSITSQEHKSSFDYLRTLKGLDHVHLSVDFQQMVAYHGKN